MIFITNFLSNFTANELRLLEGLSFCRRKWSCSLVWYVSRTHKHPSDWSVMILGCPHYFLSFMEQNVGDKNIYYNNINVVHIYDYDSAYLYVMIQNGWACWFSEDRECEFASNIMQLFLTIVETDKTKMHWL